jgi:hydroxymethylglutaryl-CoA lyase
MSPFHTPRIPQAKVVKGRDLPFGAGMPFSLVECPRDAMQGWPHIIPTEAKITYLNALLQVGFDTLDFGSFVSAKAIPQMADTAEVIRHVDKSPAQPQPHARPQPPARPHTKLLAIVANFRGAQQAADYDHIDCLGFPFSVSETFQLRNANKTIDGSLATVEEILGLCAAREKELIVYLSMAFGNPYGDPWSEELVYEWAAALARLGVKTLSVADTVGLATQEQVYGVTDYLIRQLPGCTIGVHLHSTHHNWRAKVDAALQAGCRRFDGALKGIGGCPMAGNDLVGNMDSALMIPYFQDAGLLTGLDEAALQESLRIAGDIFAQH